MSRFFIARLNRKAFVIAVATLALVATICFGQSKPSSSQRFKGVDITGRWNVVVQGAPTRAFRSVQQNGNSVTFQEEPSGKKGTGSINGNTYTERTAVAGRQPLTGVVISDRSGQAVRINLDNGNALVKAAVTMDPLPRN